jgi:imidazole glycerol-phosphate synthase subunit HisH
MKISIIDYGLNNTFSVSGAIKKIGYKPNIITEAKELKNSDKIILPGVGAFNAGIKALKRKKFDITIIEELKKGVPILGICLGFQMFFSESSEYGTFKGLNLLNGKVKSLRKCKDFNGQKIPNNGWRKLLLNSNSGIFKQYNDDNFLYFIHSYYIEPSENEIVTSQCIYEGMKINASVQKKNIFGVQFHPEKSGDIGLNILKNFLEY